MKQKHFIDSHKGVTPIFILLLIIIYEPVRSAQLHSHIYLAMHGTYGILWVLKSIYFPDKTWEQKTSIMYGLLIWFGLTLYWISPYIIVTDMQIGKLYVIDNYLAISCIISIYILGVFLHFCSDMYKDTFLRLKPNTLLSEGMFKKNRNINYFGEFLIYLSFAIMSSNIIPFFVLLLFIVSVWIPNMLKKDQSLSRYPEFEEYKKNSSFFLPF